MWFAIEEKYDELDCQWSDGDGCARPVFAEVSEDRGNKRISHGGLDEKSSGNRSGRDQCEKKQSWECQEYDETHTARKNSKSGSRSCIRA